MAKNFKVVKLDRRYKGGDAFKYLIDYRVVDKNINDPHNLRLYQDFFLSNHRIWFWDTYGPSAEIDTWRLSRFQPALYDLANTRASNPYSENWAWLTDYGYKRIYIKDDETLSAFALIFHD